MDKLVLASRNHNKIKEMEELLQPLGIEVSQPWIFLN